MTYDDRQRRDWPGEDEETPPSGDRLPQEEEAPEEAELEQPADHGAATAPGPPGESWGSRDEAADQEAAAPSETSTPSWWQAHDAGAEQGQPQASEQTEPAEPAEPAPWPAPPEPEVSATAPEPVADVAPYAEPEPSPSDTSPAEANAPSWPTEPPLAGTAAEGAWPTTPPDRESDTQPSWPTAAPEHVDEPQTADAWAAEARPAEPPPSEVEAYGAAPPAPVPDTAGAHTVPATAAAATAESTQCPRCGTENPAGLAFCRNCGQRLVAAGVAPAVERPGGPEGTMACPRCGTHNRTGVAFCQNCGANLRTAAMGYVPPAVQPAAGPAAAVPARGRAILGPVVLLIGIIGLASAYLLPFAYGSGSLYERAAGAGGYGIAFWTGYGDVTGGLVEQAYYGFAAPSPILMVLLVLLAVGGLVRAAPGPLQIVGLAISLIWSVGLAVLFAVVEVAGNWEGDMLGLLRDMTPGGIIFFLAALIVLIGTLTRFGRS